MSVVLFCFACRSRRSHDVSGSSAECCTCGARRPVEGDLIPSTPAVRDMRYCAWCRETKPADHVCPAGVVGCTTNSGDENPCGGCDRCLEAQAADLARDGSPSDLDTLWSAS